MAALDPVTGDPAVEGPQTRLGSLTGPLRSSLDRLPLGLVMRGPRPMFSPAWLPDRLARQVRRSAPDLVHLHWIAGGMLRIESLARIGRPLIWTMHDMWAFTGGCHYDEGCGRYVAACGRCPVLGSSRPWDLSSWVMRRKRRAWRERADHAGRAEPLARREGARGEPVPRPSGPGDPERARSRPVPAGRSRLGPPPARAAAGALLPAVRRVRSGAASGARASGSCRPRCSTSPGPAGGTGSICWWWVPRRRPRRSIWACAPTSSACSGTSSAWRWRWPRPMPWSYRRPRTTCRTWRSRRSPAAGPASALPSAGCPTSSRTVVNGRLAPPFETGELAAAIAWVLEDEERRRALGRAARQKAERTFDLRLVARRYAELYAEVLDVTRRSG